MLYGPKPVPPCSNSWVVDLIPHKTGGQFRGRRQSIVTLGALFGMAGAGFLLDAFRVPATGKTSAMGFAIAAVFGVSDILWPQEAEEEKEDAQPRRQAFYRDPA